MNTMMTANQKKVLKQIIKVFRENNIPYQITGGLAATFYGSRRPIYDIDIDLYKHDIFKIKQLFTDNIYYDFHHLQDDQFDLYLMTLKFDDVLVDISQIEDAYIIDKNGQRVKMTTDLANAVVVNWEGTDLSVQAKNELIEYKKLLNRPTDITDIQEMD